jgi:hypothetical protein
VTEEMCQMEIYAGTLETPPEHCDDFAVLGGEFCPAHEDPSDGLWDRADQAYADWKERDW